MSNHKNILASLLQSLDERDTEEEVEILYDENHCSRLSAACTSFLEVNTFEVRQLVKWKNDLKNRKLPRVDQPAIVVRVLDSPVINSSDDSGSPYFLEELDVVLGVLSEDGTFLTFYYDSRRFEPY
jgi:hypothetical protein